MTQSIKATYLPIKGAVAIYAPRDGLQFYARVKTVHRDGSATIVVMWSIHKDALSMGYYGDKYRVGFDMLSPRTVTGKPISQLKHAA